MIDKCQMVTIPVNSDIVLPFVFLMQDAVRGQLRKHNFWPVINDMCFICHTVTDVLRCLNFILEISDHLLRLNPDRAIKYLRFHLVSANCFAYHLYPCIQDKICWTIRKH